jgi:hypothetical protein
MLWRVAPGVVGVGGYCFLGVVAATMDSIDNEGTTMTLTDAEQAEPDPVLHQIWDGDEPYRVRFNPTGGTVRLHVDHTPDRGHEYGANAELLHLSGMILEMPAPMALEVAKLLAMAAARMMTDPPAAQESA